MKTAETYKWLMENGGPVIRYRTATELMPPDKSLDIEALQNDYINSPLVQKWLENFKPPFLLNMKFARQGEFTRASTEVHAAKDTALENVLGKLTDFGLKKGIAELDNRVAPYLEWLKTHAGDEPESFLLIWIRHEIADFLARAGYVDEPAVVKPLLDRLDIVSAFTRLMDHNIYVDPKGYKKMPANFAGRSFINPALTHSEFLLPLVYDIVGWGAYLAEKGTKEERAKADSVVNYILHQKYQQFPWGYGVMLDESGGHYWAMGWSIQLPGYTEAVGGDLEKQLRIIRLEQLAYFDAARKHPWFKASLEHLDQFRTPEGTYLFPKEYLPEKPAMYWIVGGKMALEDNPRNKKKLEVESTFRMARLGRLLNRKGDTAAGIS